MKKREFICAALMIVSIYLSLVSFADTNPTERTLSNIGAENPVWFLAWGVFTALAVYLNVRLLADKLGFENKWFDLMSKIGSFAIIGTVIIWGEAWWQVAFHWATGMTFGILCFASVFVLLCVTSYKQKRMSWWIPIVAVAAAIDVFTIIALGLTALCEIVILTVVQVALFAVNFVRKAKPAQLQSEIMLQTDENVVEL